MGSGSSSSSERCGGGHAGTGGDPGPAAVADRVATAAAELYGAGQEAFTDRRKALAASARAAGDTRAATAIAALRKPTRAAWVVNRLARADPGAAPRLAAVAAALRAAEQAGDGPRLRELSVTRGALIDTLTEQALTAAGLPDPPQSLRAEVEATLTAALADPEVRGALATGTLARAAHWSGFGAAGFASGDEAPAGPALSPAGGVRARNAPDPAISAVAEQAAHPPLRLLAPASPPRPRRAGAGRDAPGRKAAAPAPLRLAPPVTARVAAAEEQRLAREAAERTARDAKNYSDAERTVACAVTAAAQALAGEDRLEAEVHDLEQRLIRARADLAAARLTARRAEATERRARQALGRLPHPLCARRALVPPPARPRGAPSGSCAISDRRYCARAAPRRRRSRPRRTRTEPPARRQG